MSKPDRTLANVWSRALFECGVSQTITDPDQDQSTGAMACRLVYPDARDRVLSARAWRFATKRAVLAVKLTPATPEWVYLYAYPDDCLVARRLQDPLGRRHLRQDEQLQFSREEAGLYSNEPDATLVYTFRHDTVSTWPAPAVSALVWAMAADMSMGLGKDRKFREDAILIEAREIARGSVSDHNEDPDGPQPESEFMAARR